MLHSLLEQAPTHACCARCCSMLAPPPHTFPSRVAPCTPAMQHVAPYAEDPLQPALQAQTLKFSLQPGQDEPVSLETIAEPPKVLAAMWARPNLIKMVVSAMHTGSRVLVHVEGLHRAVPCRVEVSSAFCTCCQAQP